MVAAGAHVRLVLSRLAYDDRGAELAASQSSRAASGLPALSLAGRTIFGSHGRTSWQSSDMSRDALGLERGREVFLFRVAKSAPRATSPLLNAVRLNGL